MGVGIYFGCLGAGFMLTEIVLIQSFARVTHGPVWSLVTVLGTLLLSSAAGSYGLVGKRDWKSPLACMAAAIAALTAAFFAGPIADAVAPFPLGWRLLTIAIFVGGIGVCLGTPFAARMRMLDSNPLVAWAWATNGLFSVAGGLIALILGSTIGFQLTAVVAAVAYGIARWSLNLSTSLNKTPSTEST
jgi:hypothetical protein